LSNAELAEKVDRQSVALRGARRAPYKIRMIHRLHNRETVDGRQDTREI
jgi:hypothetical protein